MRDVVGGQNRDAEDGGRPESRGGLSTLDVHAGLLGGLCECSHRLKGGGFCPSKLPAMVIT